MLILCHGVPALTSEAAFVSILQEQLFSVVGRLFHKQTTHTRTETNTYLDGAKATRTGSSNM